MRAGAFVKDAYSTHEIIRKNYELATLVLELHVSVETLAKAIALSLLDQSDRRLRAKAIMALLGKYGAHSASIDKQMGKIFALFRAEVADMARLNKQIGREALKRRRLGIRPTRKPSSRHSDPKTSS